MIVVNGDSFVHEYHLPVESRWSTIVGADVNLATGAGSNDRMFSTTIEFLSNNKVKTLVMGWTRWERSFLNKSNGSRYKICGDRATDEMLGDATNDPKIVRFYYEKIFNEFTQLKNMLVQMIHMQEYCHEKINLVNFATTFDRKDLTDKDLQKIASTSFISPANLVTPYLEKKAIDDNYKLLKEYISRLNPDTWVDKQVFSSMIPLREGFPQIDDHIGIEGTQHWAKLIQKHIDIIQ